MPLIDLAFQLVGETIPLDHGYALFASLCRVVPALHGDRRIGVHPIRGRRLEPGVLGLIDGSRLRLRLPSEEIAGYLTVAGRELVLGDHRIRVGIPRAESLVPAPRLASRIVTYKHAMTAASFLEHVRGELDRLGIGGEPSLVTSAGATATGDPIRRVLRIQGRRVVGYALQVGGLTAGESIMLQEQGLGGRRRMGCGVFVPFPRSHAG